MYVSDVTGLQNTSSFVAYSLADESCVCPSEQSGALAKRPGKLCLSASNAGLSNTKGCSSEIFCKSFQTLAAVQIDPAGCVASGNQF